MHGARVLLSVSDKTGLVAFAKRLVALKMELVSTGGTLRALQEGGLPVTSVSDVTGFPEVFGGRVKTLHPNIHGAILYRRDHADDEGTRVDLNLTPINLVVVNLYPFRETVARPDATFEDAIENIDIGGPTLLRAGAKNHAHVGVVVNTEDYDTVAAELEHDGKLCDSTRRSLALKAFEHTAAYDAAICHYLTAQTNKEAVLGDDRLLELSQARPLRYGENPHQQAVLYGADGQPPLAGAQVLQGKALSYNNLIDLDAAVAAVAEFEETAAVIVKHTNPCGVGRSAEGDLPAAFELALAGDPVSAFGGIVALNRAVDTALAERMSKRFFEVLAAPAFSDEALAVLHRKKNLRVVVLDPNAHVEGQTLALRSTGFGVLAQTVDPIIAPAEQTEWRVATERAPSPEEAQALAFLWRVAKHVKSNAIVIGSHQRTFGVGAGQMSRVDAVRIAVEKDTGDHGPRCLASDAFFPFRDGLDAAVAAGVQAVVQPGGSKRDEEVIAAANEHGIAMVLTGKRHFRHG